MADLMQLVPVDLAFLATPMVFDFDAAFWVWRDGRLRFVGQRRVQLEQMSLPFAFGETLSPATKRPTFLPSQFLECSGVLLSQRLVRGGRFIQHAVEFRDLLC